MNGGKAFWFWFCLAWALFWITIGWILAPIINIFLFMLALIAMIPALLGNEKQETCAICGGRFPAQNMAIHMSYRHQPNAAPPLPQNSLYGYQPQPVPPPPGAGSAWSRGYRPPPR